MSGQGLLFAEMELRAGDIIDGKGARIYSQDVYNGLLFVQDHSGLYVVCRVKSKGSQIVYSSGGYEECYTRPEYIDYEGQGFESCLFYAIPEHFTKKGVWK
jgi:hypothetical protein